MVEENGGRWGHVFSWMKAAFVPMWVPPDQSIARSLRSVVVLHDSNTQSVVPVPICSSAYLSPTPLWLSSTPL